MKLKKIVSICLVGALAATMLTACSNSSDSSDAGEAEEAEEEVVEASDEAEEEAEEASAEEEIAEEEEAEEEAAGSSFEGFDDTLTITGMGMTLFTADGIEEVMEEVNAITLDAINVQMDYTVLEMAAYGEQLGLMFSGGESLDLVMCAPSGSGRWSTMKANNEVMDISGYVDEYAPEAMELLGDYVNPFWLDGGLYGLPVYRIYSGSQYIIMRKDILDYLDLTEQAEAISSWSDLEAIFEIITDAQDELPEDLQTTCMISASGTNGNILPFEGYDTATDDFSGHFGYDYLGDSNNMIFVEDGQVTSYYLTDDFVATCDRARDWYEKGWIYKDAASAIDNGDTAIANGQAFCVMESSEVGVESQKKQATGYEVLCVPCCPQLVTTAASITWAWAIPVTATEPEAAVAYLNQMYINPEIENLFVYGIEGRDYYINDVGEAVFYDDNVYQASDWMYPNQYNAYPSEDEGGDFREVALEASMSGEISQYYGFNVDTDPISNEKSAVYAVIDQYVPTLASGTVATSDTYDDFVDAMYAAGLQTYLDFYQDALDEWVTTQ